MDNNPNDPFDYATDIGSSPQQAYPAIASTQYEDPGRYARANQIGRQLGMSPDAIRAIYPDAVATQRVQEGQRLAATTPQAAQWLSNPDNAGAVADDYTSLSRVASTAAQATPDQGGGVLSGLRGFVGDVASSQSNQWKLAWGRVQNLAGRIVDYIPVPSVHRAAQQMEHASATIAAQTPVTTPGQQYWDSWHYGDLWHNPANLARKIVPSTIYSLSNSLPFMAETILGKGAPAAADITQQVAQARAQNNGRSDPSAWDYAIALPTGIASAAMFRSARLGDIEAGVAAAGSFMKNLVETGIRDAALGGGQAGLQYTAENAGTKAGFSYTDMLARSADAATANSTMGVALHAAIAAVVTPIRAMRDVAVARDGADYVDNLMGAAAESKARTQSPAEFQSFIDAHVKDGPAEHLYIPGEAISALFQTAEGDQSPRRIEQDPFWSKYSQQVDEATRLGGDVVVPLSDLATHLPGSTDWNQLREHVRFNPGGMSLAEAKEYSTAKAPEDIERAVNELSAKMDQAAGDLQALRRTYQFGRDLGLPHDQAAAFGAVQRDWLMRRNELENEVRVQKGEQPLTPGEEWDALNLKPERGMEADYVRAPAEAALAQSDRSILGRATPDRQATSLDESRAHAAEFVGKPLHNDATGLDAIVSKGALGKMTSASAVTKSTSPEDHALAVANADKLFSAALLDHSHHDKKGEPTISAVHRYFAPLVTENGVRAVKMTVKETTGPNEPNPLYSIETLEVEPDRWASPEGEIEPGMGQSPPPGRPGSNPDVERMLREVKDAHDRTRSRDALSQTTKGNISIAKDESGNPLGAVIRSFESGDVSTTIHEMGHYWLEDLRARALRDETTPHLAEDWQTVKDWLAENGHPVEGDTIPEAAHELWARGVERYIMEGKAPSQGLAGAFSRLAQWMRRIYQTVTALSAPISPEVRDVMDRLLASDSEIEAARGDMKMNPLEGAEALMTESERAAYHNLASESRDAAYQSLLERVMETVRNRRTRDYNAQKKELRDDVTRQVGEQPIYRVLNTLRKGENGEKVKLPKQWLIDNYGEAALEKMPKGIEPLWSDHGMDPEDIASHAGFDGADQMVHALMDHAAKKAEMKAAGDKRSPRQAELDDNLKARIEQDIPDPYHDLETEARAAMATDKAGDLMSMEARALSRKTGRRPAPWDLAKKWAQGHLQDQTTRDALTGAALARYARSVTKAGKLAEEALIKGDFEQALTHKNQQILNAALLQEAKRVKEQVEVASRKMKRIANARTMASVDQDYLDQAHALLEQVRMGTETGKQVGRTQSFERWYNSQVAEGREPIVPIEYSRLLGTQHWTSLKVADLLELNDVVSQIVNIGRLKQTLLDGKDRRDFEGAVGELVDRQKDNPVQRKQTDLNNPFNSGVERVKSRFRSFDALNLKFEQLMNFMDNALPNGPWQRMLMNPLAKAQAKKSRMLRPLIADLKAAVDAVPKDVVKGWTREVDTPELINWIVPPDDPRHGAPWRFTKDQLLAMALNLGNDGNKQRLLDGYKFNEEDVRAVLDRNLTSHDWQFVQKVFDTVGHLWPHIEELERNVNGFAPEKVEATPIETQHGTFSGGYFPAIYDPLYSTRADIDEVRKLTGGGFFSVNTRAGATNERADHVVHPLLLSLSVVTRHLNEVTHDLAFREPAGQVKRLLKDDRIKQAINNLMGPEFYKKSLDYLENVAFPDIADSKQDQTLIATARWLNKRITTAGLGFRLSTILQQPTAFSNTMAEVGNVRYAQFFGKYLRHPIESWQHVSSLSEEMRERAHNLDANITAMYEERSKNNLQLGPSKITKLAFQGIAATDLFITIPGWMAAFDKATVDLKMSDDDAIQYADMVIRKTQGAGSAKDQAAIQRTVWMKAFNPFFSYWSAHYNQLRSIGHEARRVRDANHVFNLTNRFVLAAILPMAIQGWFFGGPQGTNSDGSQESDLHYLIKAIAIGNLGALPLAGPIASHFGYGYPYKVSPWSRFEEAGEQLVHDVGKGYAYEEGEGDAPKSWVKDVFDGFAYATGKPVSQLGASLQGLYDYETGKAHPQNAQEVADLAMKGKVPQHDR